MEGMDDFLPQSSPSAAKMPQKVVSKTIRMFLKCAAVHLAIKLT
jgi:hypothetical protein